MLTPEELLLSKFNQFKKKPDNDELLLRNVYNLKIN